MAWKDDPLIIDVEASLMHIHSEKQSAIARYKKGYGFHPLCAFVDHGRRTRREPLALLMRSDNAGVDNSDDHIVLVRNAYRCLPGSPEGCNIAWKDSGAHRRRRRIEVSVALPA